MKKKNRRKIKKKKCLMKLLPFLLQQFNILFFVNFENDYSTTSIWNHLPFRLKSIR